MMSEDSKQVYQHNHIINIYIYIYIIYVCMYIYIIYIYIYIYTYIYIILYLTNRKITAMKNNYKSQNSLTYMCYSVYILLRSCSITVTADYEVYNFKCSICIFQQMPK